jgi:uncharacterized protein (DUF2252 family)
MIFLDPVRLARRQLEIDRERTRRFSHLLAHKAARMTTSPLSFLRGSAPLFYELLERHPLLAEGPPGTGWVVGDAHVENFGAYRVGSLSLGEPPRTRARTSKRARERPHDQERVVFDLNDFDDAFVGPWRFDVLRLVTSFALGGREMGANGPATLVLGDALIEAYVGAAFHGKRPRVTPPAIASLVQRVCTRTRRQLLDARTILTPEGRRFARGTRYEDLPPKLRSRAVRTFAKYAERLSRSERPPDPALDVIDVAFRVAGTGSLGSLRVAVLVEGKGGEDGAWIFDMKEEGEPSAACLVRPPRLAPAERVKTAIQACLARPPRMMGVARLRGSSMFVRRLSPQEDKIDLLSLRPEDLEPLARHLGALLGAAHRRGATRMPKKPWEPEDTARLLAAAIALAGVHEATYLAYCDLVRR